MQYGKRALLQIPQGTEGFYLEEALRHRNISRALEDLFFSWGYLPAQTPVFDFFDLYRPLLPREAADRIYRLIDREGDLLMLRSDITLFLAKQMGLALTEDDLPVRVCYADTILRHQDREDISSNEFYQVGAELIGRPGPQGDLEIVMLLIRSLDLLGLRNAVLHIGSRALFAASFGDYPEREKRELLTAITDRNPDTLNRILAEREETERRQVLDRLFSFIGDGGELSEAARAAAPLLREREVRVIDALLGLHRGLAALAPERTVRIDLSEIGNQPYHSGIVFQAYLEGADSAIAAGGRYDGLLGFFGFDAPSVGFSILLRKIEPLLGASADFVSQRAPAVVSGADFAEAYRRAEEIRRRGGIAVLGETG